MTLELIISLISLILSTACSILTVVATIRVGKLNNLEAVHKYEKKITKFELSFKDEIWFYGIMHTGEFSNYDEDSKKLIFEWWQEYKKTHKPKKVKNTLPDSKRFGGGKYKLMPDTKRRPDITVVSVDPIVVTDRTKPMK